MATITVNPANQVRAYQFTAPDSYDEKTRTFSAIIATENSVLMKDRDGKLFNEILSCDPKHCKVERIRSGAALLDGHMRYGGTTSLIGGVRNPEFSVIDGKKVITGDFKLSRRANVEDIVKDLQDGILNSVSPGYTVFAYQDMSRKGDRYPTYMAVDWVINEVSMEPIQADIDSRVRSKLNETEIEIQIMEPEVEGVPNPTPGTPPQPAPQPTPATEPAPAPAPAPASEPVEGQRALQIMQLTTAANQPMSFAVEQVAAGSSVEHVRSLLFEKLVSNQPKPGGQNPAASQPRVGKEAIEHTRNFMEIGMCRKLGVVSDADLTAEELRGSEQYRDHSAMDMARSWMLDAGLVDVAYLPINELSKRSLISNNSADFPVMLEGIARRVLKKEQKIQQDQWRKFAAVGSVSDFRPWTRLASGSIGNLDRVNENGEFKNKKLPDGAKETVQIETYGNTINVTRKMLINDDLGAFTSLLRKLTRASNRSIEQAVWDVLQMNSGLGPNMFDGNTLIHASHNNVGSTLAFGILGLADARTKMALQKDLSGNDYLDLRPHTLIVPTNLYDSAILLNTSAYADEANKFQKPNIYRGFFEQIVTSPRLTSTTAYWILADPDIEPVLEVNFLNGKQTPYLEERQEFDVDGTRWKIRHDWGVDAVGSQGVIRNPGA